MNDDLNIRRLSLNDSSKLNIKLKLPKNLKVLELSR